MSSTPILSSAPWPYGGIVLDGPPPDRHPALRSLVSLFRHWGQTRAGRLALRFLPNGDTAAVQSMTYGHLDHAACAIAMTLRERIAPGDRVMLILRPGNDFVAAFLGCLYAGAVAVPVSLPKHRERDWQRVERIHENAGSTLVITERALTDNITRAAGLAPTLTACPRLMVEEVPDGAGSAYAEVGLDRDSVAFLQYTSGSTGLPKGVVVTHGNLMHNIGAFSEAARTTDQDVFVSWLPLFHDLGLIGMTLHALYLGAPLHFMAPTSFIQNPLRWIEIINAVRGTFSCAPNFAYQLCAQRATPDVVAGLDLGCWRCTLNGAEPVQAATLDRFAAVFGPAGFRPEAMFPAYGMAESTLVMTANPVGTVPRVLTVEAKPLERGRVVVAGDEVAGDGAGRPVRRVVSVGAPIGGQDVLIVDPDSLTPLPDDRVGEIWLNGPSVAKGYWGRDELSAAIFGARPRRDGVPFGPAYLRTGDLAYRHDGEIHIAGRLKDLVIVNGRNIHPQDVEHDVERCDPALRHAGCGVFSLPDDDGIERLCVVQEVERTAMRRLRDEPATAAALFATIRRTVYDFHEAVVHRIVLIAPATLPKTSSGKVQRSACRDRLLAGELEVVADEAAPSERAGMTDRGAGPTAGPTVGNVRAALRTVLEQMAAVLGHAPGPDDAGLTFHRLGLTSLSVVELAERLSRAFGRPVAPMTLFDHPTAAALAEALARNGADTGEEPGTAVPPTAHARSTSGEDIAVIAVAGRYPGAGETIDGLAALLEAGERPVGQVPDERGGRLSAWAALPPAAYLRGVAEFDRLPFGLSEDEAVCMDPQQRLLLECCWHLLENAGITPASLSGSDTGVFVGAATHDFETVLRNSARAATPYRSIAAAASILANRLSYQFDFAGPSTAVDTACSSSLYAVHLACQSLRARECTLAVAGGVNLILDPDTAAGLMQADMLAPDGCCKAFAADADGYGRGEGVGLVLLARRTTAETMGLPVLAVIHGSAAVQDGRSNGITAPVGAAQQRTVTRALLAAGLSPDQVDAVECHGTGTPLGDPIEVAALAAAYRTDTRNLPLFVGSIKANIGHLEAAAGIAGLTKAILSCALGRLLPMRAPAALNPRVPFSATLRPATPAEFAAHGTPAPRFVGVSAFGFGGTNVHMIVGRASSVPAEQTFSTGGADKENGPPLPLLLPLSAASPGALGRIERRMAGHLRSREDTAAALRQTAGAVRRTRAALPVRSVAVAHGAGGAAAVLSGNPVAGTRVAGHAPTMPPGTVFLFGGQGGPYPTDLGSALYAALPPFRDAIDRCAAVAEGRLPGPLHEILFTRADTMIADTQVAQPVVFAFQHALFQVMTAIGLHPAAVAGHSLGEYNAAVAAGILPLERAMALVLERSRLMQEADGGMLAVSLTEEALRQRFGAWMADIDVACHNSPLQTVVSGPGTALAALQAALDAQEVRCRLVPGGQSFHSRLQASAGERFHAIAGAERFALPDLPVASTQLGTVLPAGSPVMATPAYWSRQIHQTVRFDGAIRALLNAGFRHFTEITPGTVLTTLVEQIAEGAAIDGIPVCVPLLKPGQPPLHAMAGAAAELWACHGLGDPALWNALQNPPEAAGHAPAVLAERLPNYPFDRRHLWPQAREEAGHTTDTAVPVDWFHRLEWVSCPRSATADRPMVTACALVPLAGAEPEAGRLADDLHALGVIARIVAPDRIETVEGLPLVVLAGAPVDTGSLPGADAVLHRTMAVAVLLRRLAAAPRQPPLLLAAQGLESAAVEGLLLAANLELPDWPLTWVEAGDGRDAELAAEIHAWHPGGGELRQIRLDVQRCERRLLPLLPPSAGPAAIRSDALYVVTGANGGIGRGLADWLADHGARHLLLWSRNPPDAPWLERLERRGVSCRVVMGSVADPAAAGRALDHMTQAPAPAAVFHTAGRLSDATFGDLDDAGLAAVFEAKVAGTLALHRLMERWPDTPLVLFSSLAGVIGSAGQASHAAANAWMNAFARQRCHGGRPTLAIAWGAWGGIGAAARLGADRRLAALGIGTIPPAEGFAALGRLLAGHAALPDAVTVLSPIGWPLLLAADGHATRRQGLYAAHAAVCTTDAPEPAASADRRETGTPPLNRRSLIVRLTELVATATGTPSEQVDPRRPVREMGIDSLLAMSIVRTLRQELSRPVRASLLLEHPTVEAAADALLEDIPPPQATPPILRQGAPHKAAPQGDTPGTATAERWKRLIQRVAPPLRPVNDAHRVQP